jgi:uncharacterized protein
MKTCIYEVSVPVFIRMLDHLAAILDKAAAHAEARKFDPAVLLDSRLSPDMYPLSKQVQIAGDAAMDGAARLARIEMPFYEDNEKSFPELVERLRGSIAFLETLKPEQFEGAEDRTVSWEARGSTISVAAMPYLLNHAMPKFYFHATMAYAILRHNGVELKKGDFLGKS